jgi:uncharacterized cupredoxin-like copper-binding protein
VRRFVTRAAALSLGAAAIVAGLAGCGSGPAPVTEATVVFHFSRFDTKRVTVPAGAPITFTLDNQDPIEHEWIVGTDEVHARHRTGTEPHHDAIPTEVTVPAFTTKATTVRFDTPGTYRFICHLPGHEAYGMKGTVKVVSR